MLFYKYIYAFLNDLIGPPSHGNLHVLVMLKKVRTGARKHGIWKFNLEISTGNRMNASAIKDLHYKWYLKILSKLHEPLDKCSLKEFLISREV